MNGLPIPSRSKSNEVKDADILPTLMQLPPGYAVVCCRCARRNGIHWKWCTNPGAKRAAIKEA